MKGSLFYVLLHFDGGIQNNICVFTHTQTHTQEHNHYHKNNKQNDAEERIEICLFSLSCWMQ